jgi:hypothetical protein
MEKRMIERDFRCRETPLVEALMTAGLGHRRAVCFERMLNDANFVGISADFLAALMATYAANREHAAGAPEAPAAPSVSQSLSLTTGKPFLSTRRARKLVQR